MRMWMLVATLAICATAHSSEPSSTDAFEQLKTLVGEWQADLPGFGKLTNSIRLVSNGIALEETLGTPADNETSIYTRDNNRNSSDALLRPDSRWPSGPTRNYPYQRHA